MEFGDLNWIKGLAINEVLKKNLSLTRQLLEECDVVLENGIPKIARVDCDRDGVAIVYFPLQSKEYFLGVYVQTGVAPRVDSAIVEAGNSVVFTVTSKNLKVHELLAYCKFNPTNKWDIGEAVHSKNITKCSGFIYDPVSERADACTDNIEKLLDAVENDREGVLKLSQMAQVTIQVHWYGNSQWMSSLQLGRGLLKRISDLNLIVDFDLNVS